MAGVEADAVLFAIVVDDEFLEVAEEFVGVAYVGVGSFGSWLSAEQVGGLEQQAAAEVAQYSFAVEVEPGEVGEGVDGALECVEVFVLQVEEGACAGVDEGGELVVEGLAVGEAVEVGGCELQALQFECFSVGVGPVEDAFHAGREQAQVACLQGGGFGFGSCGGYVALSVQGEEEEKSVFQSACFAAVQAESGVIVAGFVDRHTAKIRRLFRFRLKLVVFCVCWNQENKGTLHDFS